MLASVVGAVAAALAAASEVDLARARTQRQLTLSAASKRACREAQVGWDGAEARLARERGEQRRQQERRALALVGFVEVCMWVCVC